MLPLVAALVLAAPPDLLDAEATKDGLLVLGSGGAVYRFSPGGGFELDALLDGHAVDLSTCEGGKAAAVGPGGAIFWREGTKTGFATKGLGPLGGKPPDLWAVALAPDCADGVVAGDLGAAFALPSLAPLKTGVTTPLYAAALSGRSKVLAGADGVVVRIDGNTARKVQGPPGTTFLSAAAFGDGRVLLAGTGGLFQLEGDVLTEVLRWSSEVFARIAVRGDREAVVLGQELALVTDDGGRRWRTVGLSRRLGAAPLSPGLFLSVGFEGQSSFVETKESPSSQEVRIVRRLDPAKKQAPAKPKPEAAAVPGLDAGVAIVERAPATKVEKPRACVQIPKLDHTSKGFVDVRAVGSRVLVASADGTLRRADLPGAPAIFKIEGAQLLGLAATADGLRVAAVGRNALALSDDRGATFRALPVPKDFVAFAASFAGDDLVVADARGAIFRLPKGSETLEPHGQAAEITVWSMGFVDARRGFLVGTCGALLETTDGGATWIAHQSPDDSPQGVLFANGALYVSGEAGVFRRDEATGAFRKLFATNGGCVRLAARGTALAAACSDSDKFRGLYFSPDGIGFRPVPSSPGATWLLSVAIEENGGLTAVGAHEVLIRGTPEGATLDFKSEGTAHFRSVLDAVMKERKVARGDRQLLPRAPKR